MRIYPAVTATTLVLALSACGTSGTPDAGSRLEPQAQGGRDYLVGFKRSAGIDRAAVQRAGGSVTRAWPNLDAVAARLPAAAVAGLSRNPNVEYVELDVPRRALGRRSFTTGRPGTGTPPNTEVRWVAAGEYQWGAVALDAKAIHDGGYAGAGVAVCVADTGIDATHPEFDRKLKDFANFMGDGRDNAYQLNDVSQHGTHVAGTIFAQLRNGSSGGLTGMDRGGVIGVSPDASLYVARVLGDDGSGTSATVVDGVNWCVSQLTTGAEDRLVISLSLGSSTGSRTEMRAFDAAQNAGALSIAASGNDGGRIGYPAGYDTVVAVGAIDDRGNLADFSNFGRDQELVGPGVNVLSTVPVGAGQAAEASADGVVPYSSVLAAEFSAAGAVNGEPIVAAGSTSNELCGVGNTSPALAGAIALIARGTCSFGEKVDNAVASGAVAAIIYNNVDGDLNMTLGGPKSIPVVGIRQADGEATLAAAGTTGSVSVYAADYAFYDGTSMATPHVSAAAALVWSAKPDLTNDGLRSLLRRTAADLGTAGFDTSFGYGLVNPGAAISGN